MRRRIVVLLIVVAGVSPGCTQPRSKHSAGADGGISFPFLDPSRRIDERVNDLLGRLTLEEKISQLGNSNPAVERLGIPAYDWWNECLHGVARAGNATVFPQAIGLAATFDADLVRRVAEAIGEEARAKHHAAVRAGRREQYWGLTFWTPNINIYRDPRWGRGQETYGEDPFLTGTIGAAFVRGLQGEHPTYLRAAACAKHFVVHSGPEGNRHHFNAVPSPRDFHETYLPAFKALVDARVEAIMCAYNRTNDEPCCGSSKLLRELLRERWGFDGHVVTDCDALSDFHDAHKVTADPVESAAMAINNGVDVNCGGTFRSLVEAARRGLVSESTIDQACGHLFRTRIRLGMFDPPERVPYSAISPTVVNSEAHRALAREAAQKSIVLLKNRNRTLPLSKQIRSVYVVGPCAADIRPLLGNYFGVSSNLVTILEGIVGKVDAATSVRFNQGCLLDAPNVNPNDCAIGEAHSSDAIVAVLGVTGLQQGEEGDAICSANQGDRLELGLPAHQVDFLRKLREGYAKPLIVVLTGGGPLIIPDVLEWADALLFVWYPGEEGGNAVADVLFGDRSPSGRLPVTFPVSAEQLPPFDDYRMEGRTYRYLRGEPLFPFGFGLSYATFQYRDLKLSRQRIARGESLRATLTIANTGAVSADDVVQLYVSALDAPFIAPIASLKAFQRVSLAPGASCQVAFTVTGDMLALANDAGERVVAPGRYRLVVGGSSPGPRSEVLGAGRPTEAMLVVE